MLLRINSKALETCAHTKKVIFKIYTNTYKNYLFINVKIRKQYRCQSVDVWINKLWYYLLLVNLMLVVKEFRDKAGRLREERESLF